VKKMLPPPPTIGRGSVRADEILTMREAGRRLGFASAPSVIFNAQDFAQFWRAASSWFSAATCWISSGGWPSDRQERTERRDDMQLLALSGRELSTLHRCEAIIERGQKTFVEVGKALLTIRQYALYRSEYDTFQDYCQQRWRFTSSRARQLIAAARTAETVTNVTVPNEAVARELGKVPEPDRQVVVNLASEKAGHKPLTAEKIRAAAEEIGETEPEADDDEPLDATCTPVSEMEMDATSAAITCNTVAEFDDAMSEWVRQLLVVPSAAIQQERWQEWMVGKTERTRRPNSGASVHQES